MNNPPKAFITYSHKNTPQRNKLEECLATMEKEKEIDIWSDSKILPGDKWEKEIKETLEKSDILLYLISSASLASPNCNKELLEALKEEKDKEEVKEKAKVIPIVLEHCDFERDSDLRGWQALPVKNGRIKPITDWRTRAEGWQNVVEGIRKALSPPDDVPPCISPISLPEGDTMPSTRAQQGQEPPARTYFSLGRASFFAMLGDHRAAIREYNKAIELDPNYAEAYSNRGAAYGKKGDFDRAIEDCSKAIELDPNDIVAYNNRGAAYGKKGDFDRAIEDCSKAIELDPHYAEAYNNRGTAHGIKGESDLAINDCSRAIELKPSYASPYNNRGNAYCDKGDFDHAIDNYTEVIRLIPNDVEAYISRGNTYRDKGDFDRAIEDYSKAIELNPHCAELYNNRGSAYCIRRDLNRGIEDYSKAIELNPNYAMAYNNRGLTYRKKGDTARAAADFAKAEELEAQAKNKSK